MKKTMIFILICLLSSLGICNAEIKRGNDFFTGGVVVFSDDDSDKIETTTELRSLYFRKIIEMNNSQYYIKADNDMMQEYILADNSIELKIDNLPIYRLERQKYQKFSPINYKILSILTVNVPVEVVENIQNSSRVALRFTQYNGDQFTYILPNEILEEWKQVIATKE